MPEVHSALRKWVRNVSVNPRGVDKYAGNA